MAVRIVECQQCRKSFEARDWRENRQTVYCSRRCRDLAQTTRVTLTCVQCLEPFERKAYQAESSRERGPFCGMPCYGVWQRQNTEGPSSPSWGHWTNPHGRGSHRWLRQRARALARDGRRCVKCGATGTGSMLHVHHVVPWEPDQADPHALGNLVTLCARHHREAHRELGGR
jgi:5-methylcytosine-specific restriction endonuclease McrA